MTRPPKTIVSLLAIAGLFYLHSCDITTPMSVSAERVSLSRDTIVDGVGSIVTLQCQVMPSNFDLKRFTVKLASSDSTVATISAEKEKVTIHRIGYAEIVAQLYDEDNVVIGADTCRVYAVWKKVYTTVRALGSRSSGPILTALPANRIIFASLSTTSQGLIASRDSGNSWTQSSTGIEVTMDTYIGEVSVDPVQNNHLVVVTSRNDVGSLKIINVWESQDTGNSWKKKAIPINAISQVLFRPLKSSTVLVVSIQDSLRLFDYDLQNGGKETLGTFEKTVAGGGLFFNPLDSNRLYGKNVSSYSVDGGRTWKFAMLHLGGTTCDLFNVQCDDKGREYAINSYWDGTGRSRIFRRSLSDTSWESIYEEQVDNALHPWFVSSALGDQNNSILALLDETRLLVSYDDRNVWKEYTGIPRSNDFSPATQWAIVGTRPLKIIIAFQIFLYQWVWPDD
jgi:hypothetical protein